MPTTKKIANDTPSATVAVAAAEVGGVVYTQVSFWVRPEFERPAKEERPLEGGVGTQVAVLLLVGIYVDVEYGRAKVTVVEGWVMTEVE
jgi:hypothetical protein